MAFAMSTGSREPGLGISYPAIFLETRTNLGFRHIWVPLIGLNLFLPGKKCRLLIIAKWRLSAAVPISRMWNYIQNTKDFFLRATE